MRWLYRLLFKILFVVAISICMAYLTLLTHDLIQPHVSGLSAQDVMWKVYLWLGIWWWVAGAALSTLGFWYMLHLTAPKSRWGSATRVPLMLGFLFYLLSWGCPPLEPLAGMLLLLGVVMILKQVSELCARERRGAPLPAPFSQRVLVLLAGHHYPRRL